MSNGVRVDVLKYIEAEKYLITMFIDNKDTAWVEFDKEQLRGLIKLLNEQSTTHEGTMKPFDLEAAKRGEPIVTRGGVERFFIGTNQRGEIFVEDISGKHYVMFKDGMTHTGKPNTLDLFMAPKKRTVWVNVYPPNLPFSHHYETLVLANDNAMIGRIGGKAYPIEIEE
jgi:hypothetical protein